MAKTIPVLAFLFIFRLNSPAQHIILTFQEAERQGISISHLDSLYRSAVHADTALAVFRTEEEQQSLVKSYSKLLQDLGQFLYDNKFNWPKPTRCFNRIYFSKDGTIDYFLFNFMGKTEDKPTEELQKEFQRLLSLFIQDYKFPLTAGTPFAQCSPTVYMPK